MLCIRLPIWEQLGILHAIVTAKNRPRSDLFASNWLPCGTSRLCLHGGSTIFALHLGLKLTVLTKILKVGRLIYSGGKKVVKVECCVRSRLYGRGY